MEFLSGLRRVAQKIIDSAGDTLRGGPSPGVQLSVLDGGEVSLEVLQAIGYRTILKSATIVSYNMQDYMFWGHGNLSRLLLRQLSFGARIRLMTTPPPGRPTRTAFAEKYRLVSQLVRYGAEVFFNEKLHAKAYLFLDSSDVTTTIIGSANLTGPGFGLRLTPADSLVEMCVYCPHTQFFHEANQFIDTKVVNDGRTEDFATWFSKNSIEIRRAGL